MNWSLETRKISSLKDYSKNPRKLSKHDAEHLKKSLEKFGLIDKPIINPDGTIIGGHQRKRILKTMGLKEVECWVPDQLLDEKEIEELNIRLNKATGSFDFDILANDYDIPDLLDWGFVCEELFDSTAEEIANLVNEEKINDKEKLNLCPHCGKKIP